MRRIELLPPQNYYEEVQKRITDLKHAVYIVKKSLENQEKGILRISWGKYGPQYYLRVDKKDKNGRYIPKKNMLLIKKLAQQRYYQKILPVLQKELSLLEKLQPQKQVRAEPQNLISPVTLSDSDFAKTWEEMHSNKHNFHSENAEFQTNRGEMVRSKSEVLIANSLFRHGIPYCYEKPLQLKRFTVHPDFTCINLRTRQEILWEHLGMMDEAYYVSKAISKISEYENAFYFPGKNLILSMETQEWKLSPQRIERIIQTYLV